MTLNCCFTCSHAASFAQWRDGTCRKSNKAWFSLMNIFCNHPEIGMNSQCLPISWVRCDVFSPADNESIQRRIEFYRQFPLFPAHAKKIGLPAAFFEIGSKSND